MLKKLALYLFTFRGRIPRSTFWWTLIWLGLVFIFLFVSMNKVMGYASTLILYPPFFWMLAAQATGRLRDRGKSPVWFVVVLIPVLGVLWLFIDLGLRRGSLGENQYGRDPLEDDHDYLTVS